MKESKVDKDGLLIIQIALGHKQSDDVVPEPTHFDRQGSGSTVATLHIGSPLKKLQSTGTQKSASSNTMKKNRDDLKKIFIEYYKNSPQYKNKLCREHFECFVAKWINVCSEIDKLWKEIERKTYRSLMWMDLYASLKTNGVPPLKENVEYEWNCIDEMPSGAKVKVDPQVAMMNAQQNLLSTMTTLVKDKTDNQQSKTTSIRIFRNIRNSDDVVTVTTSINLTSTQLKGCKNGHDILKLAHAESVKGADSKNLFVFDNVVLESIKNNEKVMKYKFLKSDPTSRVFKEMTMDSIFHGAGNALEIEVLIVAVAADNIEGGGVLF